MGYITKQDAAESIFHLEDFPRFCTMESECFQIGASVQKEAGKHTLTNLHTSKNVGPDTVAALLPNGNSGILLLSIKDSLRRAKPPCKSVPLVGVRDDIILALQVAPSGMTRLPSGVTITEGTTS